jgi:hypothetical protein
MSIQDAWFDKDRSETSSNRRPDKTFNGITVKNEALGLDVYKNVFTDSQIQKYINALENNLKPDTEFFWNEARVTNSETPIKKARDCVDFKMNYASLGGAQNQKNAELWEAYDEIYKALKSCVDDYCRYWGINVTYYEVFNFVKYEGEGKEFKVHADDGPAYKAAVSAVIYLNDDYEGGEIAFPRMDSLVIKPDLGDIAIFPSNYIYEHASLPIRSGTKYCVVVMMDLNDLAHQNNRMQGSPSAFGKESGY